ncbi:MAG: hypothetical protein WAV32_03025 [Halobacteriota archaeon]
MTAIKRPAPAIGMIPGFKPSPVLSLDTTTRRKDLIVSSRSSPSAQMIFISVS